MLQKTFGHTVILTLFSVLIRSSVIEDPISKLAFSSNEDLTKIGLENAIVQDDHIKMRVSADRGSLISFKEKNEAEEWSFEFKFDELQLKYPEFAGIYMWYTDERIKSGNIGGIDGNFTGIMTGIEFIGQGLKILIGGNLENKKIEKFDDIIQHRDTVSPARFKDVEEFRVKIISTNKNYKIEIYEKDKLLYDSLRFFDTSVLGDHGKGKYFGITTYYEKTSSQKSFILKDIKTFKRTENPDYDPLKFDAVEAKDEPRLGHEIDYNSKEVQHLISNVEHMMAYLKAILGKPGGSTVYQSAYDAKISSFESQKMLLRLDNDIKNLDTHLKNSGTQVLGTKIGDVEMEVRNLKRVIYETQNSLTELKELIGNKNNSLILILCIVSVVAFLFYIMIGKKQADFKKSV
ncbi:putative Concanavalin A-like lectin/glucanase protein [Pseudoloma neurophilia]|uniref:Putative Concanavalin A-like lectin/glucanase protein n=1 Tax=Pseudoloma neurophilia TaxID=146866 RepID=A0A0R0M5D6_9MICR|nr:putative Concanavalin A-like lectin/glucanase protein [Pseudoloma neurophilia]